MGIFNGSILNNQRTHNVKAFLLGEPTVRGSHMSDVWGRDKSRQSIFIKFFFLLKNNRARIKKSLWFVHALEDNSCNDYLKNIILYYNLLSKRIAYIYKYIMICISHILMWIVFLNYIDFIVEKITLVTPNWWQHKHNTANLVATYLTILHNCQVSA